MRKPHTSSADLLTWLEAPISDSSAPPSSVVRSHQVQSTFFCFSFVSSLGNFYFSFISDNIRFAHGIDEDEVGCQNRWEYW